MINNFLSLLRLIVIRTLLKTISVFVLIGLMTSGVNAQGRITLSDGSQLTVFMVLPQEEASAPWPLVILMGGGPGNMSISQDTARWLGGGFAARGWAVAVPVSPDNQSFRSSDSAAKVELLISQLQQRDDILNGKTLLAGISNGGMSALGIASRNPQNYMGVAAVPALAGASSTLESLKDFPVYLRIGGADQLGWADRYEETVDRFNEIGVQLDAAIIEGAPHMFRMSWDSLEPWLDTVKEN